MSRLFFSQFELDLFSYTIAQRGTSFGLGLGLGSLFFPSPLQEFANRINEKITKSVKKESMHESNNTKLRMP